MEGKMNRNKILASFEYGKDPKPRVLCRLWVNNRFVKTISNKTVWTSVSNIKNAIHNHINQLCGYNYQMFPKQKEFIASIPIVDEDYHGEYDIAIVKMKGW